MPAPDIILQLVERLTTTTTPTAPPTTKPSSARSSSTPSSRPWAGTSTTSRATPPVPGGDPRGRHQHPGRPDAKAPDYCFRVGGSASSSSRPRSPPSTSQQHRARLPAPPLCLDAKLPLSILTDFEEFAVYDCRVQAQPTDKPCRSAHHVLTYDQYPDALGRDRRRLLPRRHPQGRLRQVRRRTTGQAGHRRGGRRLPGRDRGLARPCWPATSPCATPGSGDASSTSPCRRPSTASSSCASARTGASSPTTSSRNSANGKDIYAQLLELFRQADERYNSGLVPLSEPRRARETPRHPHARPDHRRQGAQGDLKTSTTPMPLRVLRAPGRHPGPGLRAVPGQGDPPDARPPGQGRGKARGAKGRRRLLHAHLHRRLHRRAHRGRAAGRQNARRRSAAAARSWTRPAARAPSCSAPTSTCSTGTWTGTWRTTPRNGRRAEHLPGTSAGGDWRLTTEEKKRILLNNIYGVDIDPQAVEVTKLSLLLKVLEEETGAAQPLGLPERALPDLGDNIKCGNSLIGRDYFEGQLCR